MTDGERMIWAAAYVLALSEASRAYDEPRHGHVKHAVKVADRAVAALRLPHIGQSLYLDETRRPTTTSGPEGG